MDTLEPSSIVVAEQTALHIERPSGVVEVPQERQAEDAVSIDCSFAEKVSSLPMTRYQLTCDQSPTGKDFQEMEQKHRAQLAHDEEFRARTGMSPTRCYNLVLLSLMLRLLGGGWIFMVALEYARYYVINDLAVFEIIRTACASPQYVLQAFLFPFWGVVSDRVSRKKVLVAASLASCASAWLLTIVPSIEIFIFTRILNLVADVGGPIRDAMLRDIFSKADWESTGGGATGIKARMMLLSQGAFALSTVVGLSLLKFGERFFCLPNEYTVHKQDCGKFCVQPGNYSWEGPWHFDGTLRLLMFMGTVVVTLDTILVMCFFPETLPLDQRLDGGIKSFMKQSWSQLGRPWNNLRVFATTQLRVLMAIRFIGYIIGAGAGSMYLSFYNRFEFDTFTMTLHSVVAGAATWLTTAAVGRLVGRYGDLRGIWFPGLILSLINGLCWALLPAGYGYMVFAIWPMFAGPAFALGGLAPELMAKLVPGDLQGTYQTAKSFIFRLTMAVFSWPWAGLFVQTQKLPYPFDGIPIWVGLCLGLLMLVITVWMFRIDPTDALVSGDGLEAFWASSYAKGEWYRRHTKSQSDDADKEVDGKPEHMEQDDVGVSIGDDEVARVKGNDSPADDDQDTREGERGQAEEEEVERSRRVEL